MKLLKYRPYLDIKFFGPKVLNKNYDGPAKMVFSLSIRFFFVKNDNK